MKRHWLSAVLLLLGASSLFAQLDKITIPAGTPEDQALQEISKENDGDKRAAMYESFVQKFSANPAAVAYGNWQLAQAYQDKGDLQKALDYGAKALAASPHDMDILVLQVGLAQQLKDNGTVMKYAAQGGEAYNAIGKQPKPAGTSDADFAAENTDAKTSAQSSYEFLEAAAYNAIVSAADAKTRVAYIELFTPAFPDSRFSEAVTSYAMMSFSELHDMNRLVSYGEKVLATNPDNLPTLLLLANAYVDDPKPGSVAKAIGYAEKAIAAAKADAPDADRTRKVSAGVAHSTIGYADMKEDKTQAAIAELKTATALLKGQDDQAYAAALYRLGYAYAKVNKVSDAREVLTEAVKYSGPVQQPARDLLLKVNAARAQGR
ncbi:MAG TPA: hypothetical protein VMH85_22525 [Terriglobales bacterium]|nr:hypothetical protein [Terriglobales bacterium]